MNNELLATRSKHVKKLMYAAKKRAKAKNLPFDLDIDYLNSIVSFRCPVFRNRLSWGIQKGFATADSPSLDRIIPELGYVKGNVMFISYLANSMKQNATPQQLQQFANWIRKTKAEKNDETK